MPSRKRIQIAFCLDSFAIGGTELNAVRTAEALDLDRFELCVFHLQTRGPLRSRYERLGARMTHVPIRNLYSIGTAVQGIRFARMLRRQNVEVVHSHDIYCNIFAVPWARALSTCSIIASRRWGARASRPELALANRWSSHLAHCVVANSSGVAEFMAREEGMPKRKIMVVPNFLGEEAFHVAGERMCVAQRREWGIPVGAFVVGIVARLSEVKNHVLLFKALAQLDPRFHLVVIGDGPLRAELQERARQLGINARTHFAGEVVSPENLHQCLDVSVLCSFSEGFPNSLIEAMAAAKPVIATPVGGVPDAVTDGVNGILVPVDDPVPLANAIRMLEADSLLRTRLGQSGRDVAHMKYRRESVIRGLSQLYEKLAGRRRTSSVQAHG